MPKLSLRRLILWALAALALFYVLSHPAAAAAAVGDGLGNLRIAAESIITFLWNVFA